jgi:CheY-like chemotaxis protein
MKKCSILIADDNFEDQKFIKEALLACHPTCEINYVYNGNQLLDYVLRKGRYQQNTTLPHGIILDLHMPFLNGYEVLETLSKQAVSVPVYVLSGTEPRKNLQLSKFGARAHYTKPVRPEEFRVIMKEILSDIQRQGRVSAGS